MGHNSSGAFAPTIGSMLSVQRVGRASNGPSGTETFTGIFGFQDAAGGTWNDGAAWEIRWNGSAEEWCYTAAAANSFTRGSSNLPTPDGTFIWFLVFGNANGTRYDFAWSQDSMSFTIAGALSSGLPSATQLPGWGASNIKSAGTTSRSCVVDFMGYRVDGQRG